MLLNNKSGGEQAKQFLKMDVEMMNMKIKDQEDKNKVHDVELFIYDLSNTYERNKGLNILRQE
jgi:hypothetical protein